MTKQDDRSVREILLSIETAVAPGKTGAKPSRNERVHYHPVQPSKEAREALQIALEEARRKPGTMGFKDVVKIARDLDKKAWLAWSSGLSMQEINLSVRNLCAELMGLKPHWAREQRVPEGS